MAAGGSVSSRATGRHKVMPDDTHVDLSQRVAALEQMLVERTAERDEALEYQTATSDVLKVISRSTFDLQAVMDTVMQTAARLCGVDAGSIAIREGEAYRYVSSLSGSIPQGTIVPGGNSVAGRVALEGKVVHVA